MEKEVLARAGRALRRDKQRPLDVLTRFGWICLKRWYTQERATGKYSYPLDRVLGLRPRQHASPWVVGQAVAVAIRVPYCQATRLLTGWLEAW